MSIVRIFLPLIYCMLVGTAYSLAFKKKFLEALGPAFMLQIILMLATGLIFQKLSLGIWFGVILAVGVLVFVCARDKSANEIIRIFDLGVVLFTCIYFFVFISNAGKHYNMSGEFTYWGWFVRESYNNDYLYSISTKLFDHKGYVPGVSLFETLWCRLSFRYSEPNAYRGIQMLQTVMLLPAVIKASEVLSGREAGKIRKLVMLIVSLFVFMTIPLFAKLPFYHTLYNNLILGVFVFYCFWITISESFGGYSLFVLGLSVCNLMLCSNSGLFFAPIVIVFYAAWHHMFADRSVSRFRIWLGSIITAIFSSVPLCLFMTYLKSKGVEISASGTNDVRDTYLNALISKGIVGELSYIWVVIGIAVIFVLFWLIEESTENKRKIGMIAIWAVATGIYYAFITYLMSGRMNSELGLGQMDNFEKHMSTYVLAAFLIIAATYANYVSVGRRFVPFLAAVLIIENALVFFDPFQMLPGVITHDEVWYEGHIDYLNGALPEGARLLFVTSAADENAYDRVQFYCEDINMGSVAVDEFIDECDEYEYLYFFSYDDSFTQQYQDAFESQDVIAPGKLYKIEKVNGKIRTEGVM